MSVQKAHHYPRLLRARGASGIGQVVPRLSTLSPMDTLLPVTKRLVDVDDQKLEAVCRLLGTQTLKATVAGALDEVLALDFRRKGCSPR